MPRVRVAEIQPLVKLCTDCITESIKKSKFAFKPFLDFKRDGRTTADANSELATNPFHLLPVALLEEIIRSITCRYGKTELRGSKISVKILDYLITPQLEHLSLSFYSDEYYLSLFPKLGNLLELDLQRTEVNDNSLRTIGICCFKLRSLNLNGCFYVRDTGIYWLCGVDPAMENGTSGLFEILQKLWNYGASVIKHHGTQIADGKSGLCRTLEKLNLFETNVTPQGVQTALKHLRSLRIIDNFNIVEALVTLSKSAVYDNKFSISKLCTCPGTPYIRDSLRLVLPMCHSLNHISIYGTKGLKDSDLLCLKSLKMLRTLKIYRCLLYVPKETEITFDGGVAPLLKVFGKSLETLGLECLDFVRISTIIECCPNLIELGISGATGSRENERDLFQDSKKKPPVFKELKKLNCFLEMQVECLLFLLASPLLEDLSISHCDALTDDVFVKIVKSHHFQNLKQLSLTVCDSLTNRGVDALLNNWNPLECIDFFSCKNISNRKIAAWRSLIRKKKWNLEISKYGYMYC